MSRRSPLNLDHFTTIPWCHALLSDPTFTPVPTGSRIPKSTTEDSFFAETLQTPRTILALVSLHSPPVPNDPAFPGCPIREIRTLISLGDGLNGHPGLAHGGLIGTLLDEVSGVLLTTNLDYFHGGAEHLGTMTAYLNVGYKRPMPTPGVYLVTARYERVEGRKKWIESRVVDAEGNVLAVGKALFLEVKEKL